MKLLEYVLCLALLTGGLAACNKATEYQSYLDGKEVIYPGTVSNAQALPQIGKITVRFNPSSDQSISKYLIYWRNKSDSMFFTPTTHNPADKEDLTIPNIPESEWYNFVLYSINENGRYSVPTYINNARSIGSIYLNSLRNRLFLGVSAGTSNRKKNPMDSIYIEFKPNPDTFNVTTKIYWTDKNDVQQASDINGLNAKVLIPNFKIDTWVYYLSFYKPIRYTDESYTPKNGMDSVKVTQNLF